MCQAILAAPGLAGVSLGSVVRIGARRRGSALGLHVARETPKGGALAHHRGQPTPLCKRSRDGTGRQSHGRSSSEAGTPDRRGTWLLGHLLLRIWGKALKVRHRVFVLQPLLLGAGEVVLRWYRCVRMPGIGGW